MAMAPDVARNMVVAAIFAIFAPVFAIFAVRGAHIMNFGARALGVMVDDRTRQLSLFMVDLRAVTAQFLSVTRQFTAPMRAGDAGGERGQADRACAARASPAATSSPSASTGTCASCAPAPISAPRAPR